MKKKTFIKAGDKFGRLTALRYIRTGKHHRRYFLFRCDCGNEKILQVANVSSGKRVWDTENLKPKKVYAKLADSKS